MMYAYIKMSVMFHWVPHKLFSFVCCLFKVKLPKICNFGVYQTKEWKMAVDTLLVAKTLWIILISFLTKFYNNKVPHMETLFCKMKIRKFQKMYSLDWYHWTKWFEYAFGKNIKFLSKIFVIKNWLLTSYWNHT